jgi:hypothetical protein
MTYTELVQFVCDICENTFPTDDMNMFIKQAEQKIYNTVQIPSLRKNVTGTLTTNNKYLSTPTDFLSVYSLALYLSASTTATGVSGELTIAVSSAANLEVGQSVSGTGIGTGAAVRRISGTTIYLTVPNSGTVSGTVTFQGDYKYLLNKDVNFIREAYKNPNFTGEPEHYALFGPNSVFPNELTIILGPTPDQQYYAELHYYYYPESIVTAGQTWLGDNFDSALLNGTLIEAIRYMKGEADMVAMYQSMYDRAMVLLKQLGDGKQRQDAYRDGQIRVQVV